MSNVSMKAGQAAPAMPEGYVILPEEMTEEMSCAFWIRLGEDNATSQTVFDAVIAAAPSAPAQQEPIRLLQTDAEYKTMLEYTNHLADLIDGDEGHELWPIFLINQDIIMQWEQRPDFKEPAQERKQ